MTTDATMTPPTEPATGPLWLVRLSEGLGRSAKVLAVNAELMMLRRLLIDVVAAWGALPGGRKYSAIELQCWLADDMGPAIDRARAALGPNVSLNGRPR